MESGFIQVPEGNLWFDTTGAGPDVVLIHPGLWDSRTWDETVVDLRDRYRVTRYDVRGYGRSSFPLTPYSNLEDLLAVLDHLGIERAAVVGCSMGGNIAIGFTIEHPDRVSCLVPVASGISGWDWPEEKWAPVWSRIQESLDREDTDTATEIALEIWAPLGTTGRSGSTIKQIALENSQQFRLDEEELENSSPPSLERLATITAPTLVVLGKDDVEEITEIGEFIASRVPGARQVFIDGADHVVNMRQREVFANVVGGFLDEVFLSSQRTD
ncbi:MAG: alpha/beta hydrolase [Actinomycetota bacterium]|nr:alpha/beta hydrolase [Actinomycetota bacterium]